MFLDFIRGHYLCPDPNLGELAGFVKEYKVLCKRREKTWIFFQVSEEALLPITGLLALIFFFFFSSALPRRHKGNQARFTTLPPSQVSTVLSTRSLYYTLDQNPCTLPCMLACPGQVGEKRKACSKKNWG